MEAENEERSLEMYTGRSEVTKIELNSFPKNYHETSKLGFLE